MRKKRPIRPLLEVLILCDDSAQGVANVGAELSQLSVGQAEVLIVPGIANVKSLGCSVIAHNRVGVALHALSLIHI